MSSAVSFKFIQYLSGDEKPSLNKRLSDELLGAVHDDERWDVLMTRNKRFTQSETGLNFAERVFVTLPRFPVIPSCSKEGLKMQELVERGVADLPALLIAGEKSFAPNPLMDLAFEYTDLYHQGLTESQLELFSFSLAASYLYYDKVFQLAAQRGASPEVLCHLYLKYTMPDVFYKITEYGYETHLARVSQGNWVWPENFSGNLRGDNLGRYELWF